MYTVLKINKPSYFFSYFVPVHAADW